MRYIQPSIRSTYLNKLLNLNCHNKTINKYYLLVII